MSSWGSAQAQTSPGTPKDGHLCPSLPKRIVRVASHEPGRRPGAVALPLQGSKGPEGADRTSQRGNPFIFPRQMETNHFLFISWRIVQGWVGAAGGGVLRLTLGPLDLIVPPSGLGN